MSEPSREWKGLQKAVRDWLGVQDAAITADSDTGWLGRLLRQELFALIFPTILGVLFLYLALLVQGDMMAGLVLLAIVCAITIVAQFPFAPNWGWLYRIVFSVGTIVIYSLFGWYYAAHFERPITKADLDRAMVLPPHLVIQSIQFKEPNDMDNLRLRTQYSNEGQAPLRIRKQYAMIATNPSHFSVGQLDDRFRILDSQPYQPWLSKSPLQEWATQSFFTPDTYREKTPITKAMLEDIRSHGSSLYILVDIEYEDTRDGSEWRTEDCGYYDYNVPKEFISAVMPINCETHNGPVEISP